MQCLLSVNIFRNSSVGTIYTHIRSRRGCGCRSSKKFFWSWQPMRELCHPGFNISSLMGKCLQCLPYAGSNYLINIALDYIRRSGNHEFLRLKPQYICVATQNYLPKPSSSVISCILSCLQGPNGKIVSLIQQSNLRYHSFTFVNNSFCG